MLEQIVEDARQASTLAEKNAELDAEFAKMIAPILSDRLEPLKAMSDFDVAASGNTVTAHFKRSLQDGSQPSINITLRHHRPGFAYVSCRVYRGRYTTTRPDCGFELTKANVERVVDSALRERQSDFKFIVANWI